VRFVGTRATIWAFGLAAAVGLTGVQIRVRAEPAPSAQPPAPPSATDNQSTSEAYPAGPRRVGHVIIVSEDGLRPDALELEHTRNHGDLIRRGCHSFQAQTIRHASTLPAHASMLSGVDDRQHGLTWNSWVPSRGYIRVPTIFDEAEEHGLHTAAFVGKRKLEHIMPPGSVEKFDRAGYLCRRVADEASRYFVDKKPDLMFVHFSDPDEWGHADGWMSEEYARGIHAVDRCLGKLVAAVQESGQGDATMIIVSADHGGHNHTHSGRLKADRLIPWIAVGPGLRHNYRIAGPIDTRDTAATTLYALGLPIPKQLQGHPLLEIFEKN
jgi:predicted AlkP superfamily pyrophosphatase or phosphodiesterase